MADSSTCVNLASFNMLTQSWGNVMPMLVTLFTLLAIVIMAHKKIRGAVLIGILGGMGLYYLLGLTVDGFYAKLQISVLSPIAQLIPSCATAAALIYVGLLMMGAIRNVDWDDYKVCVPAFLTLIVMPFTYNISYGIAFGLLSYIVISLFTGDAKKIKPASWVIAALFVAMLALTH